MSRKQRHEEFHQIVLEQRKIHLPQIICFICQSDDINRKKMYCTQCHAILCSQHIDQQELKNNCQHNFEQYFQSCPGCGTIMKEEIKENNQFKRFDITICAFITNSVIYWMERKLLQRGFKISI